MKTTIETFFRCGVVACALVLAAATAFAGGVEVDPDPLQLVLNPGDIEEVVCTVTIPCDAAPPKADIYLLADTTGSMGEILQAVQDAADELVDTLLATPNVDVNIGVGNYKDFNDFDDYAFQHQQSPTGDDVAIKDAINDWFASGGSDAPEAQLYALSKLANDPAVGFRTGTDVKRIIVWFGDRPGHDPVCETVHNDPVLPFDVTEATTIADLLAAGEGGTTVVAISTRIGEPGALDADPDPFAEDYMNCDPDGGPNQATNITGATNGQHIEVLEDPDEIVGVILTAVEEIFETVDVSMEAIGDIIPFITNIDPLIYEDVEVPLCEEAESVQVEFTITFEGQPCIENQSHYFGGLHVLVDGDVTQVKNVEIVQEECVEVVCAMVVGAKKAYIPWGDDPSDVVLLKPKRPKADYTFPTTMEDIPDILVPEDPSLEGKHVYLQVYMYNPVDFPDDPWQFSNGLDFTIGSGAMPVPYGPSTTIDLWANAPVPLGGRLDVNFSIDGL